MTDTNRLRVLRAERRITQMVLARKLGISQTRYWQIENSHRTPDEREQARIAKILKVSVAELGFPAPATAEVTP